MGDALSNALKRRDKLLGELAEIDQFIALHRRYAGMKREDTDIHEIRPVVVRGGNVRRKRGRPTDFAGVAERVIRDTGKPLQRGELVREIEKRDMQIPSSDKERYLGTIMWRHRDRFVNIPDFGYWLKDAPYPPARYTPGSIIESPGVTVRIVPQE